MTTSSTNPPAAPVLQGLRILSVEQYGAGPFGTQYLADLGAEVIKIENRKDGGDVGRMVGPHFFGPGDSHFYQSFSRNKKSLTLDMKQDAAKEVLWKLVESADVIVENFRPGAMEGWNLGPDELLAANPKLRVA